MNADDIKFEKEKWKKILAPYLGLWKNLYKTYNDDKQSIKIT